MDDSLSGDKLGDQNIQLNTHYKCTKLKQSQFFWVKSVCILTLVLIIYTNLILIANKHKSSKMNIVLPLWQTLSSPVAACVFFNCNFCVCVLTNRKGSNNSVLFTDINYNMHNCLVLFFKEIWSNIQKYTVLVVYNIRIILDPNFTHSSLLMLYEVSSCLI